MKPQIIALKALQVFIILLIFMSEKTQTELELEAVNAAILKVLKDGIADYQIYNRKVTYHDLDTLKKIQSSLRLRLAREQRKVKGIKKVGIRF